MASVASPMTAQWTTDWRRRWIEPRAGFPAPRAGHAGSRRCTSSPPSHRGSARPPWRGRPTAWENGHRPWRSSTRAAAGSTGGIGRCSRPGRPGGPERRPAKVLPTPVGPVSITYGQIIRSFPKQIGSLRTLTFQAFYRGEVLECPLGDLLIVKHHIASDGVSPVLAGEKPSGGGVRTSLTRPWKRLILPLL